MHHARRQLHLTARPAPRVPVPRVVRPAPKPRPICDLTLELALPELTFPSPLVFAPAAPAAEPPRKNPLPPRAVLTPRAPPTPTPRPRTPAAALAAGAPPPPPPPAMRFRSASSVARRRSSSLRSSSAARRCAASCCSRRSSSTASRSREAPRQSRSSRSRWLCSVCERMRVQVLRRVEALVTVWETLCTGGGWLATVDIHAPSKQETGGGGLLLGREKENDNVHPCCPWPARACR